MPRQEPFKPTSFLIPALLTLGAMVILVASKWPDMFLPFFWDELGVYAPGILYMVDHGPGLLPSSLPPELSRGHPLLFYFLFALHAKIFGFSLFNIHFLSILITIALGLVIFFVVTRQLNPWLAFFSTTLFWFQPNVFAISSLALPELMLALWIILALWNYYRDHWWLYVLFGSLAILTKETGILVVGASALFALLFNRGQRIISLGVALAPLAVFVAFLLIQRAQHGWWFFPLHTDLISFEPSRIAHRWSRVQETLLMSDGRLTLTVWITLGLSGFLSRSIRSRTFFVRPLPWLLIFFVLAMVAFSSINIFMARYQMVTIAILCLFAAFAARELGSFLGKYSALVPFGAVLVISYPFSDFSQNHFRYDQDINYREIIKVQQQATEWIETQADPDEPFYANFPLFNGFIDHRLGYLIKADSLPARVRYQPGMKLGAIIKPGGPVNYPLQDAPVLRSFEEGIGEVQIYGRPEAPAPQ